jgi:hypothetical protein
MANKPNTKKRTDFVPVIIGKDTAREDAYKRDLNTKRNDLSALHEYCSRFIEIEDKTVLFKNFKETFLKMFYEKYQTQFPSIVTLEKMLDFASVDMQKIETLAKSIEAINIELNSDFEPIKDVDFNIYTKTQKENLLFATMKRLCQDIDTLKNNGVTIFPMAIQNGTMQTLKYDFKSKSMQPNLKAIEMHQRG